MSAASSSSSSSSSTTSPPSPPAAETAPRAGRGARVVVIGLTGGIASGKSAVARFLGSRGCTVIDADVIGHSVYAPGTDAALRVAAEFGAGVITGDGSGSINRRALAPIVFGSAAAMKRLTDIVWPAIHAKIVARVADVRAFAATVDPSPPLAAADAAAAVTDVAADASTSTPTPTVLRSTRGVPIVVVVVEAAILIEAKWHEHVVGEQPLLTAVWVVETEPATAKARLMARNSLSDAEATKRMAAQISNAERRAHAHVCVPNNDTLDDCCATFRAALEDMIESVCSE